MVTCIVKNGVVVETAEISAFATAPLNTVNKTSHNDHGIAETTTALTITVAEQSTNVKWQEYQPYSRSGH